jgi:hypothetical protein|nr:MAG TPA: hypothetical protein [Crassvirales sp.]
MITFEQFLKSFCRRARIEPILSKEELTAYIRKEFFSLCGKGIIQNSYLKRYKSQFEKVGVLYNKTNYEAKYLPDDKNLCIFVENEMMNAIGENSLVYCRDGFVILRDNTIAMCKNSNVCCYDNSKIHADWCGDINVSGNAEAAIKYCSLVLAEDNSKIEIEHCMAFALDNVTVKATNTCYIQAQDNVKITAENNSCIIAKNNVEIKADSTCLIKRV